MDESDEVMLVDVNKLCLVENDDDECWEIIERDGMDSDDDEEEEFNNNDAIIAKFYAAPELAIFLINALKNPAEAEKIFNSIFSKED